MKNFGHWLDIHWFEIFIFITFFGFIGMIVLMMVVDYNRPPLTPEEQYNQNNPYTYTDILGRTGRASNCYESGGFMSGGSGLICELDDGTKIQVAQFDLTW